LIEALASGKPVIATRLAGVKEAVMPGVTGLTVPPKDPETLAWAIRTLVSNDELRREMGRRARLFAEEKYDWNEIVNQYIRAYELASARSY
jgi:glycosyltransferase involved in cell wall biosynthesis